MKRIVEAASKLVTFGLFLGLNVSSASGNRIKPIKVLIIASEASEVDEGGASSLSMLEQELTGTAMFRVEKFVLQNGAENRTSLAATVSSSQVIVADHLALDQIPGLVEVIRNFVTHGGGLVSVGNPEEPASSGKPEGNPSSELNWKDSGQSSFMAPNATITPTRVSIQDAQNPIIKGMPRVWMHLPDPLNKSIPQRGNETSVLATATFATPGQKTNEEKPIMWVHNLGNGRVLETSMGNTAAALRCNGFITILQRAIQWAATGKVTQKLPNSFPTANTTSERTDLLPVSYGAHLRSRPEYHVTAVATLSAMRIFAESIGVKGVALIADFDGSNPESWISEMVVVGTFKRQPALTTDKGMNLLAVAYSKAAEMADTLKDSGSKVRDPLVGEFGWPGGVIVPLSSGYVLVAFSGGKQDQDVSIARVGAINISKSVQQF